MKYLNVILNSTSGFLIITLALFMLSLASATFFFWRQRFDASPELLSVWAAAAFSAAAAIPLFSMRHIANFLTDYSIAQQWPLSFFVLLLVSIPYYFSGLGVLSILNKNWQKKNFFQKNYLFDMLGIIAAVFVPHFFIESLGPEKIMAIALLPLT